MAKSRERLVCRYNAGQEADQQRAKRDEIIAPTAPDQEYEYKEQENEKYDLVCSQS
jgi:hypothetical protein